MRELSLWQQFSILVFSLVLDQFAGIFCDYSGQVHVFSRGGHEGKCEGAHAFVKNTQKKGRLFSLHSDCNG